MVQFIPGILATGTDYNSATPLPGTNAFYLIGAGTALSGVRLPLPAAGVDTLTIYPVQNDIYVYPNIQNGFFNYALTFNRILVPAGNTLTFYATGIPGPSEPDSWFTYPNPLGRAVTNIANLPPTLQQISSIPITPSTFIGADGTSWVGVAGTTLQSFINLSIGTDVQAWSPLLDSFAALSPGDGLLQIVGTTVSMSPITLYGDVDGTGANLIDVTLADSGVTAGTYNQVVVDSKGRVIDGTTVTESFVSAINTGFGLTGGPITTVGTISILLNGGTASGLSIGTAGLSANVGGGLQILNGTISENLGDGLVVSTNQLTINLPANSGLSLGGTGLSVLVDNSSIVNSSGTLKVGTSGVTAGTYGAVAGTFPIITIDSFGRITAASVGTFSSTAASVPYVASSGTATASGMNSFAGGGSSQALANNSIAIGYTSIATDGLSTTLLGSSIAIGGTSLANAYNAVAVGAKSSATGQESIALGWDTTASGQASIAIGQGQALGSSSIAIGQSASTNGTSTWAIAIGADAFALAPNAITLGGVVGGTTIASGTNAIMIGVHGTSAGSNSIVIGNGSTSTAGQTIIGYNTGTLTLNSGGTLNAAAIQNNGTQVLYANGTGLSVSAGTVSVGVNAITYGLMQQTVGSGVLLGGTAASSNISEISLGTSLAITGGTLDISTIGTAGTYNQVTVNSRGRVTSGTNITVATLAGSAPVHPTDAGSAGLYYADGSYAYFYSSAGTWIRIAADLSWT